MHRLTCLLSILVLMLGGCTGSSEVRDLTRRATDNVTQLKQGLGRFVDASDQKEAEIAVGIANRRISTSSDAAFLAEQEAVLEISEDERRLKFYRQMQSLAQKITETERIAFAGPEVAARQHLGTLEPSSAPKERLEAVNKKLAALLKRDSSASGQLSALFTYAKTVAGEIRKTQEKTAEVSN